MTFRRLCLITIILLAVLLVGVATASAADRTHVVKPGETLSIIARLYGLTVEQLAAANGITNPNLIYAGQTLTIPGTSGGPGTGTGTTTSYTVVPGDTLFSIARRFGTTVSTLASLNGLSNVNVLYIGQVLLIPSQGGQPVPTAVAPTSAPQPTAVPVQNVTYTVQRGDTLSQIALRFGTTYQAIMLLNNLSNPDLIFPGQVLVIRRGTVTPATPVPGATATATPPPPVTLMPTFTLTPSPTPEITSTYPPGFSTPTPIVSLTQVPAGAPNLLADPGFEGPSRAVGGDENVSVLQQWQPFYCDQPYMAQKCRALRLGDGNRVDLMMVRPVYRPISESARVHSGAAAQLWSCPWTACRGGVYQTVQTTPGAVCEAGAFVQSWSSNKLLSFSSDLSTRAERDNATWFVIVDAAGGTNAYADGVLTSRGFGYDDNIYDAYTPISYTFTAAGSQVTVFFENLRLWPFINNTNYIDDAYLRCTQ